MSKISLIIITGLSGTGKTTLGKKIAREFQFPFICKDDFKEILFDTLGSKDREWSKKIGMASYDIIYHVIESNLRSGKSMVVETNFDPKFANEKFLALKEKYKFSPFQIRCITDGEVLFERFKKRSESVQRHSGHVDSDNLEEWKPIILKGKIEALEIGGEFIDVDTSEFKSINYSKIFNELKTRQSKL